MSRPKHMPTSLHGKYHNPQTLIHVPSTSRNNPRLKWFFSNQCKRNLTTNKWKVIDIQISNVEYIRSLEIVKSNKMTQV